MPGSYWQPGFVRQIGVSDCLASKENRCFILMCLTNQTGNDSEEAIRYPCCLWVGKSINDHGQSVLVPWLGRRPRNGQAEKIWEYRRPIRFKANLRPCCRCRGMRFTLQVPSSTTVFGGIVSVGVRLRPGTIRPFCLDIQGSSVLHSGTGGILDEQDRTAPLLALLISSHRH